MNKLQTTLSVIATLIASSAANAAPIQTWGFETNTKFGTSNFDSGLVGTFESPTLVSWGAVGGDHTDNTQPSNLSRSALEVTAPNVVGSMELAGPAQFSGEVTHYNNTILASFSSLTSTSIITDLTLFPEPQPAAGSIGPLPKSFTVNFKETSNSVPCGFPSESTCDDIFVVAFGDLDFSFKIGKYLYTVAIGGPDLGVLPVATCAAAGVVGQCFGVTTPEEEFTPVGFNLSINATYIPEPGVLALLGVGLFGFGVARRRMSK